ncbi:ABC transporter permease [Glaciecola sp. KUL10]|uniref:ABC transporter permease n=1 Tax=Glaciecola sp. (strain KUL10) TaxID=2161813 RepID=UPI000D785774|nr:ABC transporter permease [Glaciecola sp. KUL10]GBL03446.1 Na+ ABC transporter permease [Glaciecola sp. KUL10]
MWLVFFKEMKELLRDRKSLFFMIALPIVVFPLLIGIAAYVGSQAIKDVETKTISYSVIGAEYAPDLVLKMEEIEQFERVELSTSFADDNAIKEHVKAGNVDFVLVIPDNYGADILSTGQITLRVFLNDSGLNMVNRRLTEITKEIAEVNQASAFMALQVNESQQVGLLEPIVIEKVNVADERENWGEKIGAFFPYIIFILCLQGAMLPASDLGAGEKERGTLETLLISPIERNKLVMGKFLTIAFAGVTSALITVVSMAIWGLVLSQGVGVEAVANFMAAIGAIDFILMFLMLVPVVAILASTLLSLSIYARSFKEAQGYMQPLVFIVIVPVLIAMMPGIQLKGIYAWIPLTNVALAIKELIKGTMDYMQLFAIFASTTLIAVALIGFCIYWFKQEKVLFR